MKTSRYLHKHIGHRQICACQPHYLGPQDYPHPLGMPWHEHSVHAFADEIFVPSNKGLFRNSDASDNTYYTFPGEDKVRIVAGGMYAFDVGESSS